MKGRPWNLQLNRRRVGEPVLQPALFVDRTLFYCIMLRYLLTKVDDDETTIADQCRRPGSNESLCILNVSLYRVDANWPTNPALWCKVELVPWTFRSYCERL
ncbi:hypothetical protein Ac2012v2_004968 [Leucoagaricus gongylophorus]